MTNNAKKSTPVEWTTKHSGPTHAAVNIAGGALSLASVGYLAHVDPIWAGAATAATTVGTLIAESLQGTAGVTRLYRAACWAGTGSWVTYALATSPWSGDALGSLIVGTLGMGLLAPVLSRRERRAAERERRAVVLSRRARTGDEWSARLARVCGIRGAQILNIQTWPARTGYSIDVDLPGGTTWRSLAGSVDALASDLRLPIGCGVEVTAGAHRGAAVLHVSTVNALISEQPFPADYSPLTVNNPFGVGIRRNGETALMEVRQSSTLVIGQKGSGKSNELHIITAQLARMVDVLVWHIDLSGGRLSLPWLWAWHERGPDGGVPNPPVDWVASTSPEALRMTEAALRIIKVRGTAYRALTRGADSTDLPISPTLPEIVIVVDEGAEAAGEQAKSPQLRKNLSEIQRIGRGVGVNVVMSALRATADMVADTNVKAQSANRIGMRVSDPQELAYLFGWHHQSVHPEDAPWPGCGFAAAGQ
ncbi:MAG TPA: hypothetical protein VIS06_10270, partial [Mycobacteriales bacterium]